LFHQIWKVGQTGHVTRIVSGCEGDNAQETMQTLFRQQIQYGIPTGIHRFHIHFTPDYSKSVPGVDYNPLNKPYGILHWMEHSLNMPTALSRYSDTMFIILDPDQILLRPFTTRDFGNDVMRTQWHNAAEMKKLHGRSHVVEDGSPVSQVYYMGGDWIYGINTDVQRVVDAAWNATRGNPAYTDQMQSSSHLYHWTSNDAWRNYAAGPPYIATGGDMYRIVLVWAAIAVPVYQLTLDPISEMFAYSTAAAHLHLPHHLAANFMLSNPVVDGLEGWGPIDAMKPNDLCQHTFSDYNNSQSVQYRIRLPYVLHYCQEFHHGPYYFFKYYLSNDFFTCDHPILSHPNDTYEANIAVLLSNKIDEWNSSAGKLSKRRRQRHLFTLCHLLGRINDAVTYWKDQHCGSSSSNSTSGGGATANYNPIYTAAKSHT
jgi:peptidyl serine alpha-galactosyltransferase